jgi:hypothetical protein
MTARSDAARSKIDTDERRGQGDGGLDDRRASLASESICIQNPSAATIVPTAIAGAKNPTFVVGR